MRVFLDTNVVASAVATRGLCADVLYLALTEHQLVVGETVLIELRRVLRRKFGVPDALVRETEGYLRREAEVVTQASGLDLEIRDPDDLLVLGEAVSGRSDVLVTGDRDLLDLADSGPIRILSPRAFWELLRSGG